ncbi:MAG TPA: diguanylate cyclase [Pyrinomonadaceae bacterium]|nr:diguanylate cyclase [Pyrinomonadaceae bacterium]
MSSEFAVIYMLSAIVLSSVLSFYAWRNKTTRGHRYFALSCMVTIPWMAGEVIGRLTDTYNWQWFGEWLRYFGAMPLPVLLLMFIRQYFGRELSKREVRWLLIIPAISWLVMITDPFHGLFFVSTEVEPFVRMKVEYGIYFWAIHTPYSYILLVWCLLTVIMELSRASSHYRQQIMLLLLSMCVPIAVNMLALLGVVGKITPYSFPVFFSIMAYAIFRLQFLKSNPIAYETVFETIHDGVLILDNYDIVRDVNPAAETELGISASEAVGTNLRHLMGRIDGGTELYDRDARNLGELAVETDGQMRYLLLDSIPISGALSDVPDGRIVTIRDNTDRHMHQLSLEAMAFHDPLTRLANRRKFEEEVERAIDASNANNKGFCILYFDLDRFKVVNDTLGHDVGDELLKYVAARVASILRKPDLLARLGGDEFALLLHDCDENGAKLVIERMIDNVCRPFRVGENSLVAELSIGTAFYPKDGINLGQLLRNADAGMYESKQNGGGWFVASELTEVVNQRVM